MTAHHSAPHWAKFSMDAAQRAYDEWGANCGPGAIAAALDKTLDDVRPHLGDFEAKRYTSPSMMYAALKSLGIEWLKFIVRNAEHRDERWYPSNGLVRIQWEGPWTKPGVPAIAAYPHTHWIASRLTNAGLTIFDINCMCVGGWVSFSEWRTQVVPWLLKEIESKGDGKWRPTHYLKVPLP